MAASGKRGERGSEIVEFALISILMFGVIFLLMDVCWLYFVQSTLQNAAQAGVRYAVTGQTGANGQDAAIKAVVQDAAMGFLNGQDGAKKISIRYYSPGNLSAELTGNGSNSGGNVVEVSIQGVTVSSFAPFLTFGSPTPNLSASSTDVMESTPLTGPAKR